MVYVDVGIGQVWFCVVVVQQVLCVQLIVIVWMLNWIVDQYQVCLVLWFVWQCGEIEIGLDIVVYYQEWGIVQYWQCVEDVVVGFQWGLFFVKEMQVQVLLVVIIQGCWELFGQLCGVDYYFVYVECCQVFQVLDNQWFVGYFQQWFGCVQGQWVYVFVKFGGKDQCFYWVMCIGVFSLVSVGLMWFFSSCCRGVSL